MSDTPKPTLSVDGKDYDPETLSDNARTIIRNIQFCDQEVQQMRMRSAALQTARQAYVNALKRELEGEGAGDAAPEPAAVEASDG
jgi:Arc/MetJ family transcription regulator